MNVLSRIRWVLPGLCIVLVGAIAYSPALLAGFVFDDHILVEDNGLLRGPFWRIWATTTAPDYWPLTWTSFWIEWRFWGEHAFGYHAINIALHITVAILLWQVLQRLAIPGAWLAGIAFVVHPVTVESVAWISELKNTLSAVLFLGMFLAWLRFDEKQLARHYFFALFLFTLALLAKASVVLAPVVLLGIALCRRGKLVRSDFQATAPFFVLALVIGLVNIWFQRHNAMSGWLPDRAIGERLASMGWTLWTYLQTAFLPFNVRFVYPPWPVSTGSLLYYVPLFAIIAGVAFLIMAWSRWSWAKSASFGLGYHTLMLLPVLGFIDIAYFSVGPVSNHLQYLALMGPVSLTAAAISKATSRYRFITWFVVAGLLALGTTTYHRATAFESDLTLWESAVREAPDSALAHSELSSELYKRGRLEDSLRELETTMHLTTEPEVKSLYRCLWFFYSGRQPEAVKMARETIRIARIPSVRRDAAWVLTQCGQNAEALATFQSLAREAPNSSDYTYWYAASLSREGRIAEAADVLRIWCRQRPGNPTMEQALALTLVRLGKVGEARERASATLGVSADDPRAERKLSEWIAGKN